VGLFDEKKTRGRKSRDNAPLRLWAKSMKEILSRKASEKSGAVYSYQYQISAA
jgi:hypothetical protein